MLSTKFEHTSGRVPVSHTRNTFVSVIIPLENVAPILSGFLTETLNILDGNFEQYEVILIDNCSDDDTANVAEELLNAFPHIRYLRLSKIHDQDIAIRAGLDAIIGDVVVCLSPLTDPPALIPEMVSDALAGNGFVKGIAQDVQNPCLFYRLLRRGLRVYCRYCLALEIPEHRTTFFAFTRKSVNVLLRSKAAFSILLLQKRVGMRPEHKFYRSASNATKTHRPLLSEIERGINLIVSTSSHPLRFVTLLGLLISSMNIVYVGYIVTTYLLKEDVMEGWTTTSLQLSVMFFFVFLFLSVFAEYMGKIMNELTQKEMYVISEERTSTISLLTMDRRNVTMLARTEPLPVASHAN